MALARDDIGIKHGLVLIALWAGLVLFVSPRHEFPLNDDWDFTQSAQHLLETGQPRFSPWANAPAIFPQYWGALFVRLAGGFSFTALRASTLVMGLAGVLGCYGLLRQGGVGASESLLGAAALLVNPLYFSLSYTFMTDVPFMALMILALNAYMAGIRRGSLLLLFLGSLVVALAAITRQPGLLLPVAAVAGLLAARARLSAGRLAALGALPAAAGLAFGWWLAAVNGIPWMLAYRLVHGTLGGRPDLLALVASRMLASLPYLGLFALPALAGLLAAYLVRRQPVPLGRLAAEAAALLAIGAAVVFAASKYPYEFPYFFNIINRAGLGAISLPGGKAPLGPPWLWPAAAVVAFPAGAVLGWLGLKALVRRAANRGLDSEVVVIWVGVIVATAGGLYLEPYLDRYLLPWLPLALFIPLRWRSLPRAGLAAGWLACAALGWYSVMGTRDYLAWNEALWTAGRTLVAQGAAPEDVDGAYEWIGWHEFQAAPPPVEVTADLDPLYWMSLHERRYLLSFSPLDGYEVVLTVPYGSQGETVYGLRRP